MSGGGWLKLHRRGEALALLLRHPHALSLLTLLATRARFSAGRDPGSGVELQVGEALTGRGDAAAIGATPRQYRVCKDQLIRWGFVTTSMATKGATWGTVLKLTDSAIYEVVPLDKGHLEGQVEGHAGATWGPPGGHESKTVQHIDPFPPPPQMEEEVEEYVWLADQRGRVKNRQGLKRHILSRGGLTQDERRELQEWKDAKAAKEKKAREAQALAARLAAEKQNRKDEVERAWNEFQALSKPIQAKVINNFRADLHPLIRRDFSLDKPSILFSLKEWLPDKIKEHVQ